MSGCHFANGTAFTPLSPILTMASGAWPARHRRWEREGRRWEREGERWLTVGLSGVKWGITTLGKGVLYRMFLGTYEPRLDEKGRLILPARFRDDLAAGLVITKGQERCLYVWPAQEFATLTESMRQAPVTAKSARDYMRVMFAGAHDEIPDKQGRVTIPTSLRSYAGLERECVVIGANTRVEIWDLQAWESYLADREKSFAEVSEEVFPGLF
jgi:MraZ protein